MESKISTFYYCPQCVKTENECIILSQIPIIKILDNGKYSIKCSKNHETEVDPENVAEIYKTMIKAEPDKILCSQCKSNDTKNMPFYYNFKENSIICNLCSQKEENKNNSILLKNFHNYCHTHNKPYSGFCYACKTDFCEECDSITHKECVNKELFYNVSPSKLALVDYEKLLEDKKDYLKQEEQKLEEKIAEIRAKFNHFKDKYSFDILFREKILNTFKELQTNHNVIKNLNNFLKMKTSSIDFYREIKKILDDINKENYSNKDLENRDNLIKKLIEEIKTDECNSNDSTKSDINFIQKMRRITSLLIFENRIQITVDVVDKNNAYEVSGYDSDDEGFNLNKEVFFLCDRDNNDENYSYDELNSKNTIMFIDDNKVPFSKSYTFDKPGKHVVKYFIKGKIKTCKNMFNNCFDIIDIDLSNFGTSEVENMSHMFYYCKKLKKLSLDNINFEKVISMNYMFYGCLNLKSITLGDFNTRNTVAMSNLFGYCYNLESISLNNFEDCSLKDAREMFVECNKLEEVNIKKENSEKIKRHLPKNKIKINFIGNIL